MQTNTDKAFRCWQQETLLIQELKPTLNDTVSSEKLYLY